MPSPFPGMDPYIEGKSWANFHFRLIGSVADSIMPEIRPKYVVIAEERVYLEHEVEGRDHIRPDLTIVDDGSLPYGSSRSATAAVARPVAITLPIPEEMREHYLTIRNRETQDVVTIIEVLSPANKRPGSDGKSEYLRKREEVLRSRTHLVEIDLLRGGDRLPVRGSQPECDYIALVSRERKRPRAEAYPIFLRQQLPITPIPLAEGDPDISLDLQKAFTLAYDRAGYDYSLDYGREVEPPLDDEDSSWAAAILAERIQES